MISTKGSFGSQDSLSVDTDWGWTKHCAPVKTEDAKVEQREENAVELMKRNLLKAARFEECAVEIAKAIQNILKALDIAKRAMLPLKKLTYIIREKS